MSNETWLPIFGYEGLYEISTKGRIKSLHRKGRILKPIIEKDGYVLVNLSKNGKTSTPRVHRLVALTFILTSDTTKQINHLDGNKQNNNVDNLEWCTPLENTRHAIKLGIYRGGKK